MMVKFAFLLLVTGLTFTTEAAAKSYYSDPYKVKPKIHFEGELRADVFLSETDVEDFKFKTFSLKDSYLKLSYQSAKNLRAVLKGKFYAYYDHSDHDFNSNFDFEKFIDEAYITIENRNGLPVVLVVGKQIIAYGQRFSQMPNLSNNATQDFNRIDEVFGFTAVLDRDDMKLFDKVELSFFENESGDLRIGKFNGAAIKLTKLISSKLKMTASFAQYKDDKVQKNFSTGLIYTDNTLTLWSEFYVYENKVDYPNSNYAGNIGVSKEYADDHRFSGQFEYVDENSKQYSLGYEYRLSPSSTLGAEIRFTDYIEVSEQDPATRSKPQPKDEASVHLIYKKHFGNNY